MKVKLDTKDVEEDPSSGQLRLPKSSSIAAMPQQPVLKTQPESAVFAYSIGRGRGVAKQTNGMFVVCLCLQYWARLRGCQANQWYVCCMSLPTVLGEVEVLPNKTMLCLLYVFAYSIGRGRGVAKQTNGMFVVCLCLQYWARLRGCQANQWYVCFMLKFIFVSCCVIVSSPEPKANR